MSERDPRVDPMPGDMFRVGFYGIWRVLHADHLFISVKRTNTSIKPEKAAVPRSFWGGYMKDATVIRRAEESANG